MVVCEGLADPGGAMRREHQRFCGCLVFQVITHCVDELLECKILTHNVLGKIGLQATARIGGEICLTCVSRRCAGQQ